MQVAGLDFPLTAYSQQSTREALQLSRTLQDVPGDEGAGDVRVLGDSLNATGEVSLPKLVPIRLALSGFCDEFDRLDIEPRAVLREGPVRNCGVATRKLFVYAFPVGFRLQLGAHFSHRLVLETPRLGIL